MSSVKAPKRRKKPEDEAYEWRQGNLCECCGVIFTPLPDDDEDASDEYCPNCKREGHDKID